MFVHARACVYSTVCIKLRHKLDVVVTVTRTHQYLHTYTQPLTLSVSHTLSFTRLGSFSHSHTLTHTHWVLGSDLVSGPTVLHVYVAPVYSVVSFVT